MDNLKHLIGKKVIGNWGAKHPKDFGKIHSIEKTGWMLIEWNDKRTHMIHMLDFSRFNIKKKGIGVFLDESEAA